MGSVSITHWLVVALAVAIVVGLIRLLGRKRVDPRFDMVPHSEAQPAASDRNFIQRHWRGNYSLAVSYWVVGTIGTLILTWGMIVAEDALDAHGYDPAILLAAIAAAWVVWSCFTVWQLVGIWRSAGKSIERQNRLGKFGFWGAVARFMVIAGFLRAISTVINSAIPQLYEASQMAASDDPSIPPYTLRLMRDGTELEIIGGIKFGLHREVLQLLRAAPRVRTLHLDSVGGRLGEAKKLVTEIQSRGLVTYVTNQCLSACAVVFVAGRERWIANSGRLGFHASDFPGMSKADLQRADRDQAQILKGQGVSADFVSKALATPSTSMWYPTVDELKRAAVIHGVAADDRFAASGFGVGFHGDQVANTLSKELPALRALQRRAPAQYRQVSETLTDGYQRGLTRTDLYASVRQKLLPILQKQFSQADDDVVLELGQLVFEQLTALARVDYRKCYIMSSDGSGNFARDLPRALVQRELALQERIIDTAAPRRMPTEKELERPWSALISSLKARHGAAKTEAALNNDMTKVDQKTYCEISIDIYRNVLAFDRTTSISMLRHIFEQ